MSAILMIMVPVMVAVLIASTVLGIRERWRLRGCDHVWDEFDMGNTIRQWRICQLCEIKQTRLSEDYWWGRPD